MIASNVLSRHSLLRSKNCAHVSNRLDAIAVTGKTLADIDITCVLKSRIEGALLSSAWLSALDDFEQD